MAKLLLVCDYYLYSYKGKYYFKDKVAAGFYDRYLRVFEKLRIANRVIEEERPPATRYPIDDFRIEICPIPIFHGPFEYFKNYHKIGRVLKNVADGCDAVVLRLPCTAAQRLGDYVIKKKIPYAAEIVFDAHDGAVTSPTAWEKLLWHLIDKKMRKICYHADGVSCVTQFYLQKRYYSKKVNHFKSYYSSIGLPISFYSSKREFPNKAVFTIAHVDLQIGLHSRKGTDEVLKAVSILKRQGIILNISFAGDDWGDNKTKILHYAEALGIADQISFPGFLNMAQISDFLDKSDVFVFPTKAEGLPRAIIEAMAKGLPVVTTPVSGNPELIDSHFLVNYDDVETLADRIKEIVLNKATYESESEKNFNKALGYEASVLESRRDAFYGKLKDLI